MRSVQHLRRLALAGVVALVAFGSVVPTASAADTSKGDQLQDVARSTYQLVPARHVVHVTTTFSLTNKAPSKSRSYRCTQYYIDPYFGAIPYTATCTIRTTYYYYAYSVWIEVDATHVAVTGDGGKATVKRVGRRGDYQKITMSFARVFYGGTRHLTLTYDLPAGGPRSTAIRRAGFGYASFCADGPGVDRGSLRIIVPAGFKMVLTKALPSTTVNGQTIYTLATQAAPWGFRTCLTGSNDADDVETSVATTGGPPVTIRAWRDDPTWSTAVRSVVETDLPKLAALLGPIPGPGTLTVQELATEAGSDYYTASTGIAHIRDSHATGVEVAHRLSLAWFGDDLFASQWLRDGYADWAIGASGATAADTPACTKPGPYPGGTARLPSSHEVLSEPTGASAAVRAWERQASCYVVATVASAIGPDRMLATLATLRGSDTAYGSVATEASTGSGRKGARTWREWLDVVELQGLVPAGADRDLAAALLVTYGATDETGNLADRRKALTDLSALQARTGVTPAPVTSALADWRFDEAEVAIASANAAWNASEAVIAAVPDVDPASMAVRKAVRDAASQADLDAAAALGSTQAAIAADAKVGRESAAAPRDGIQAIGLIGSTLPADADLVAAVARTDRGAVDTWLATTRSLLGGARDAGIIRIAVAVGVVAGLLVLLLLVRWFRRRRRRRALAFAVAGASPPDDGPAEPPAESIDAGTAEPAADGSGLPASPS